MLSHVVISMFIFLRSYQIIFRSGFIILYFHQQCTGVQICPHHWQIGRAKIRLSTAGGALPIKQAIEKL